MLTSGIFTESIHSIMNLIKKIKKNNPDSLEEVGIGLVGSRDVNLQ